MGLLGDSIRFALGMKPRWASDLPPHLTPTREQVARLEMLRVERGLSHQEFFVHIGGHPQTTRRAQRNLFEELKGEHPSWSERELMTLLVLSRWQTAVDQGGDLFNLTAVTNELDLRRGVENIVDVNRDVETLIEAMIQDEERRASRITSPQVVEQVTQRVTAILRDDGRKSARSSARPVSHVAQEGSGDPVTIQQFGALLATGAALNAFFGEQPLLRLVLETDQGVKDTKTLRRELLSFCLVPFERVAVSKFPEQAGDIRSVMVAAAESGLRGVLGPGGEPPTGKIAQAIEDRLEGYAMTLGASPTRSDWERLAFEASAVIKGQVMPDPKLAMILGIRFASSMKHLPTTLDQYQVVTT